VLIVRRPTDHQLSVPDRVAMIDEGTESKLELNRSEQFSYTARFKLEVSYCVNASFRRVLNNSALERQRAK
jgi:hypothetical protein